jgi:hypothetical protein
VKARRVKRLDPAAPAADGLERTIRVRADELFSFLPGALEPAEHEAQHDMRIAAKRLRYLLELSSFCFGPYAEPAARRMKDLQDVLGEMHDCDVMLPRVLRHAAALREADARALRELAGDAEDLEPALSRRAPARNAHRGLQSLAVHLQARRALLHARFVGQVAELERKGFRARLDWALQEGPTAQNGGDPLAGVGGRSTT